MAAAQPERFSTRPATRQVVVCRAGEDPPEALAVHAHWMPAVAQDWVLPAFGELCTMDGLGRGKWWT